MLKKYIIYYRVSTKKQRESGLGLKAQRTYIHHFIAKEQIVAELTEVQSGGTLETREVLKKAIRICKQHNYILAIAKIDRLSRKTEDALFIYNQLGGNLYSCDIPNLDKFTLTLFMAIADRERELISIRTKQALAIKKEEVGEWRNSKFSQNSWELGQQKIKQKALLNNNNLRATQLIVLYKEKGLTLQQIADKLNQNGFRTAQDKYFVRTSVKRLWERYRLAQP